SPRRFYRAVERPLAQLPPPPNNNFANRIPLSGLGITVRGYTVNASKESGEPGNWPATIWYSWTAPANGYVVARAAANDWYPDVNIYTGSSLSNLAKVNSATPYPNQGCNGLSFYATAGTTYQIQAGGWWGAGGIELAITFPPDLIVTSPFDGMVYLTATNVTISALTADVEGTISGME